mgnify:CR=1 FL=1
MSIVDEKVSKEKQEVKVKDVPSNSQKETEPQKENYNSQNSANNQKNKK